jgi:formate-dependent nitrite reductase membrane component NrfD
MLKIKSKTFEKRVYPTLQREWIEKKGLLLWLGLFFMELGAAMFFVSTLIGSRWGAIAGLLIAATLGGGTHVLFLGHPFRALRAFKRPKTSWISRGLILISLFQIFGVIYIVTAFLNTSVLWVMVLADIFAVATILYGGYEVADVKPIKIWHSSLLPIQLFSRSVFVALAIILTGYLISGKESIANMPNVTAWVHIALIVNAGLFLLYIFNLFFDEGGQPLSLKMMTKGDLKFIFWHWVVIGGIIIPLVIAMIYFIFRSEDIPELSYLAVVLQFVADAMLRYCSMRSAYYPGIFPVKAVVFS